jgi:hypothetical protein
LGLGKVDSFSTSHTHFIHNVGRYPVGIMQKEEEEKNSEQVFTICESPLSHGCLWNWACTWLHLTGVLIPVKAPRALLYTYNLFHLQKENHSLRNALCHHLHTVELLVMRRKFAM